MFSLLEHHAAAQMDSYTGMMILAHLRLISYVEFTNCRPARVYKPLICLGGRNNRHGLGPTLMLAIGLPTMRCGSEPALPKSGLVKYSLKVLDVGPMH